MIRTIRPRTTSAFSLAEVLISLALCTFCLTLLLSLIPLGLNHMRKASEDNARSVALRHISAIARTTRYDLLPSLVNNPMWFDAEGNILASNELQRIYRADITVEDSLSRDSTGERSNPSLRRVRIAFSHAPPDLTTPRAIGTHILLIADN
ncbi:hypothetical protein DB346_02480 [Verrucomicrobia bacterium LW23]|nr:hypothetical protein DB346_04175 [Verrucomicrobia bacterium LW23]PTY04316.1 hypothetical protein DB346_02480 [Verrucomicrobia bacterium LW23]